ncbi:MAG: hypothetical protein LBV55_04090 [Acholeplasmatales bacterium]|jgi:hypothetical protein|nr:hypothetical protein [Acholeplasmatales bacterium]
MIILSHDPQKNSDGLIIDLLNNSVANIKKLLKKYHHLKVFLSCEKLLNNQEIHSTLLKLNILGAGLAIISSDLGLLKAVNDLNLNYYLVYNPNITINSLNELEAYENLQGVFISPTSSFESLKSMVKQTKIATFLSLKRLIFQTSRPELASFNRHYGLNYPLNEKYYLEESLRPGLFYELISNSNGTFIYDQQNNASIVESLKDDLSYLVID